MRAPSPIPNPFPAPGRRAQLLIALAVTLLGAAPAPAEPTNAPARLTYDSFRLVSDRNIFNPNRYARATGRRSQSRSTVPASRIESFTLAGVLAYEKGTFAFFDGTKSNYKQALQAGGSIGEYQVTQVTADGAELSHGTNTFHLKVGMQMRREDEGDWFVTDSGETPRRRVAASPRARGGFNSRTQNSGEVNLAEGSEPEVIVLDNSETEEANGAASPSGNGAEPAPGAANGNDNGDRATAAPETSGVSDPVLLRLMQRRQQMTR